MANNLAKLMARHSENKSKFNTSSGSSYKWLDLRNDLPDGETKLRVVPSPGLDPKETFIFRGKHRGIIPPNDKDLKRNPDAKYKALTCNLIFDDYCHVCDLVDKLAEEEDKDLREQASYHAALPVVYFNAIWVGQEQEGLYIATTMKVSLIETIQGWIAETKKGGEYENLEFMHPKTGKALTVKRSSKERKDGKVQVDIDLQVGQKSIPLDSETLKKHQDLTKILKQVDDETVKGYLKDLYPDFM